MDVKMEINGIQNPPAPPKASQDSQDGAIDQEQPFATVDEGLDQQAISSSSSGDNYYPLNGHHDPKRRRIYLALLGFSLLNALIGLAMLLTWMLKYRAVTGFGLTDKGQLSNLHPLLMYTFMVSLNMYSILIYRTHYTESKQRLKWAHAILSGTNIVMSLLGVAAMYKAHLMSGLANFYSLHSWIGALTNAVYLSQFLFGLVAFLKPGGVSQATRAKLMPWHRLIGAGVLLLASVSAITGITELVIFQDRDGAYSNFTAITFIANIAGLSVILMTTSTIYLVTAPQYLRPALPSEGPTVASSASLTKR